MPTIKELDEAMKIAGSILQEQGRIIQQLESELRQLNKKLDEHINNIEIAHKI